MWSKMALTTHLVSTEFKDTVYSITSVNSPVQKWNTVATVLYILLIVPMSFALGAKGSKSECVWKTSCLVVLL